MLTEAEMERARLLHDLLLMSNLVDYDVHDQDGIYGDYFELIERASLEQFAEIAYEHDPEAAVLMLEAAEKGQWRRRGPVRVLSENEKREVGVVEGSLVLSPGWRQEYARWKAFEQEWKSRRN